MSEGKKVTVVTHNSKFHADDIFAVAVLSLVLGEENFEVVRTRDPEIIASADFVVDVGGVYSPEKNQFDHHQDLQGMVRSNNIPYASFGLVWKKFGHTLTGSDKIFEKIDRILAQPVDALDNGMDIARSIYEGVTPYEIGNYFDAFVPDWKEGLDKVDAIFMDMVTLARNLLQREIRKETSRLEAESFIKEVYEKTEDKRVIVLDQLYPAREFLMQYKEPLFVIFPVDDGGKWYMKPILSSTESLVARKVVPESWWATRDEEFEKVSGVPGAIFCHKTGYVVIAKTKEAILKLAEIAINS